MERIRRRLPAERKRRREAEGKSNSSVVDKLDGTPDVADGCLDIDELIIVLVALAAIAVAVFFIVPLLIALGELLIVVLFALLGGVFKVVFRRPWTVEATGPHDVRYEFRVVGWRRSGQAVRYIAERLTSDLQPPLAAEVDRYLEAL